MTAPSSTRRNHLPAFCAALSPPFELHAKFRHIFFEAQHPILLLPSGAALTPNHLPKHRPPWQTVLPHTCHESREHILRFRTVASMLSESVLASASAYERVWLLRFRPARSIRGAWSGEPVVVCCSEACSGYASCTHRVVSRSPRLSASAPSAVSARPGGHRFPSCTAGTRLGPLKTPRYLDAVLSTCADSPAQVHKIDIAATGTTPHATTTGCSRFRPAIPYLVRGNRHCRGTSTAVIRGPLLYGPF